MTKKVLILNGSPRMQGNTRSALKAAEEGIRANMDAVIDFIDVPRQKIMGCVNCDGCRKNGGNCVLPDDTNPLIRKVLDADVILFGSPVYWMGISAQLKLLIDKFYCQDQIMHGMKKKIGIIAVGAAETSDRQYETIKAQFEEIAEFLSWEFSFMEKIAAWNPGDVQKDAAEMKNLGELWKKL